MYNARILLFGSGTVLLALAGGLFFQLSWAAAVWPFPTGPLSFSFMAAILAGSAVPLLWIGLTGEIAALAGYGLAFGGMYAGIAGYAFVLLASSYQPTVLLFGVVCAGIALVHLAVIVWSRPYALIDQRVTPRLVRLAFAVETLVLAGVGSALLLVIPNILPWPLSAELSVTYGWVFLGLALYYLYAVVQRAWGHAIGPLLGFLAYDLVLIGPLLGHYATLKPEHQLGQITATAIILFSGILGLYFLLLNKDTRPWKADRHAPLQA